MDSGLVKCAGMKNIRPQRLKMEKGLEPQALFLCHFCSVIATRNFAGYQDRVSP